MSMTETFPCTVCVGTMIRLNNLPPHDTTSIEGDTLVVYFGDGIVGKLDMSNMASQNLVVTRSYVSDSDTWDNIITFFG